MNISKFDITCICDNNVKLSSHLWGEHGISFLIEWEDRKLLFDTGQSFDVLSHNASELGKTLYDIDSIVLSHGHYDHTGGLEGLLDIEQPKIYAHPYIFQKKYKIVDDKPSYIGIPLEKSEITDKASLFLHNESVKITKEVITTGEVERINPLEEVPDIFKIEEKGRLIKDDILDDQSLIINNGEEALVLLGCNHSGLVNTIEHCKKLVKVPIKIVSGGTHLVTATKERMDSTISYLKDNEITVYGFHCTGDNASFYLRNGLGDYYERGYVGMHTTF